MSTIVIEGCAIATVDDERREFDVRAPRDRGHAVGRGRRRAPRRPSTRDNATAHRRAPASSPRRASSTATTTSTSGPRAATRRRRRCSSGSSRSTRSGSTSTTRSSRRRRAPGWRRWRARAARRRPTTTTSSRGTPAISCRSRSTRRARSACASTRAAARWTSGSRPGGLPPDDVVEDRDAILAACAEAIDRHHDPSPGARVRIALAPTSPFSVTGELMRETADARARRAASGCTRTWPRPTTRSASASSASACGRCSTWTTSAGSATTSGSRTACTSTPTSARGWARPGPASRTARRRTGASARGSRRCRRCWRAGAPVGLGVDGAASNECGELVDELRAALVAGPRGRAGRGR